MRLLPAQGVECAPGFLCLPESQVVGPRRLARARHAEGGTLQACPNPGRLGELVRSYLADRCEEITSPSTSISEVDLQRIARAARSQAARIYRHRGKVLQRQHGDQQYSSGSI